MADLNTIAEALVGMDAAKLEKLVKEKLEQGVSAKEILNEGLIQGMDRIGRKMEKGEMYIPEVLLCAKIMSRAVESLKPLLGEGDSKATGKAVIGTVKGDLHDVGKNLVILMLESAGFEVVDLGIDVPPEKFVKTIREEHPDILGLSALLTTTIDMLGKTIDAIRESGCREGLKIMVGGAPVTQAFADKIGADGYAADAGGASRLARSLVGGAR
jgi:5-methyltetrahydrofolate--homocysteine methyltransferase